MIMQEAKILHCEDSEAMRDTVAMVLGVRGIHRVVAAAESLAEAQQRLEEIARGSLDANVVLLDGHLKGGNFLNHPKVIRTIMRDSGLHLPVVGLSMDGLAERGVLVGQDIEADLLKDDIGRDLGLLDRILDGLPEPETTR